MQEKFKMHEEENKKMRYKGGAECKQRGVQR